MSTWITICEGCKQPGWAERRQEATDGATFADLIESEALPQGIRTRRVPCTMGCERACNVIVQSKDKIGYSLGKFAPDAEKARAIVDYALLHQASDTGQVPFREWPLGVKGHFVSRQLPLPEGE